MKTIGFHLPVLICDLSRRTPVFDIPLPVRFQWAKYNPSKWSIEKVSQRRLDKVADLAEAWARLAKLECAILNQMPIEEVDDALFSVISTSHRINQAIANYLTSESRYNPRLDKVYLCKDRSRKPCGIMILKRGQMAAFPESDSIVEAMELVYMATHPKNLKWPVGIQKKKSEGVGSNLFQFAARKTVQLNLGGLFFESDVAATPFYLRFGVDEGVIQFQGKKRLCFDYYLTAAKIRNLV